MLGAVNRSRRSGELRVMPWWFVLLGVLVAVVLGWLVLGWLLDEANRAGQADTRARLRIDAIRTGLAVVAGTGGTVALLLAARRQWINERAQRHQEAVAADDRTHAERVQTHAEAVAAEAQRQQEQQARAAEHDAAERRLTDLYTKAVDLLGSDRVAARLGGLYALDRVGAENEAMRPVVAAVICAYLRTPAPHDDPDETEVRRTAQRLLTRHLRDGDETTSGAAGEATYWPEVRLDLAGATLTDFDAAGCTLLDADLSGARFHGATSFAGARIAGRLRLDGARFEATATFDGVRGDGDLVLDDSHFEGEATFRGADLGGAVSCARAGFAAASFVGATFHGTTTFDAARFGGHASFRDAVFRSGLSVEHAEFVDYAGFQSTRFEDMAFFRWTVFRQDAYFEKALFAGSTHFARAEFHSRATFDDAVLPRKPRFDHARATRSALHHWPPGPRVEPADDRWLVLTDT
jgi:uncharacterized protein YjbI with pentapeptide repeats